MKRILKRIIPKFLLEYRRITKLKRKYHKKLKLSQKSNKKLLALITYGNKFNLLFAVSPQDEVIGKVLAEGKTWGEDQINSVYKNISKKDKILVVGAHIGTVAIPVSLKSKRVTAIEAMPQTFQLLKINIAINSIKNITPLNIAASNKCEKLSFLCNKYNTGGSKIIPKIKKRNYYYDSPDEISVNGYKLDDYLTDHDYSVIIMDIEGSEYFALQGMKDILSHCKILYIEFFPIFLKDVSGVNVSNFLDTIKDYFSYLYIPSKNIRCKSNDFLKNLQLMYDNNEGEDYIIFSKNKI